MRLRKLVVVGLVGFLSLAANIATAEDAVGPGVSFAALDGVSFIDPAQDDIAEGGLFDFTVGEGAGARFLNLGPGALTHRSDADARRQYEISLVAHGAGGLPVDVGITQRGGMSVNEDGDIAQQSRGSELRLGRGLRGMRREASSAPSWYFFAASDDEALTWRPGSRSEFGGGGNSFSLQDRVEIGDIQAGITYEANGLQASLAYVEREISVRSGSFELTEEESFTGFTLTMRHP